MNQFFDFALINAGVATVLALIVGGIALVWRRPALLHCLWLVVLLKLLTPPVIPISIPRPNFAASAESPIAATAQPETQATTNVSEAAPGETLAMDWVIEVDADLLTPPSPSVESASTAPTFPLREALLAAWLGGSIVWFTWTAFHLMCFQRLLRHARSASARFQQRVDRLAKTLGLANPPPILLVPGAVSPMIWALGSGPRLIFPTRLLDRLDDEQLDALILHELAHVLRRDHWVRLLELVVTALFWWHPVLWWAKREIHETEEQCCDAWVVWALGGGSRSYALALVQTVEFCSQARAALPAAASGIGPIPHLRRRLTMIMQGTTPRSMSWTGACAVLGLGLLLPLAPVHGQAKPDLDVEVDLELVQDSRDQQIEVLKKALQVLEEQKKGDKGGKSDRAKGNPEDIEKARNEVERRERDVNAKRKNLQDAEKQLQEARRRLASAEGRPVPADGRIQLDVRPVVTPRVETRVIEAKPGEAVVAPGEYKVEARIVDGGSSDGRVILVRPDGKREAHHQVIRVAPDGKQPGEAGHRLQLKTELVPEHGKKDLEGRLERLIKEVEEIRREMRRQPRSDARPDNPPSTPPPPRPVRPGTRADNAGRLPPVAGTPAIAPGLPAPPAPPTPPTPPAVPDEEAPVGEGPAPVPPPATPPPTAPVPPPPPPPSDDGDGESKQ